MSGAVAADRPGPRSEQPGTAGLLCALSYGSGLAAAERMEHGTNTAFVGVQLGHALGAGAGDLEAVFYGALVKDAGCGACGAVLARYFADDEMVPRLDLNLVDRLHVQDAVHYQYERHDGRSPAFGRRAEEIPRPAQILHLALAADLVRGLTGAEAAAAMVSQRTGTYFDPDVAGAYLDLAGGLWPDGDEPVPLTDVLSCAPGTPVDELPGDRRLAVCEALADFADLKSARRGSHSHRVASLAARAAAGLGLPAAEQQRLRRAGLVHDLGKIAVPYRLLEQAGDDTAAASRRGAAAALAEPVRLHPYYAQRILSRVGPLADLAADVGAHHERLDGSGYPLGLTGPGIPTGARVLAAADVWAERAGQGPPDLTGDDGLDPECVAALLSCPRPGTGHPRQRPRTDPGRPALSSRELEVLRLLTDGASNPDISKTLHISRRTAEHHVEHILTKLDVTSRTAAVAHALTHELLS